MEFRAHHMLMSPAFAVYADIETKFQDFNREQNKVTNSMKKLNELKPLMAAYFIKFSDDEIFIQHPELKEFESVKVFEGELCLDEFFIALKQDCKDIKNVVRIAIPLSWSDDLEKRYQAETVCFFCQKAFGEDTDINYRACRHHDHLTG